MLRRALLPHITSGIIVLTENGQMHVCSSPSGGLLQPPHLSQHPPVSTSLAAMVHGPIAQVGGSHARLMCHSWQSLSGRSGLSA